MHRQVRQGMHRQVSLSTVKIDQRKDLEAEKWKPCPRNGQPCCSSRSSQTGPWFPRRRSEGTPHSRGTVLRWSTTLKHRSIEHFSVVCGVGVLCMVCGIVYSVWFVG